VTPTVGNHRGEPSGGNRSQDQAKRAQSEATTLVSGNRHLADNDACQRITQNHRLREYGHDRDDLRNVIDDKRHNRARTSTPPRRSLERVATSIGRDGFYAFTPSLRYVNWPDKFKPGSIDRYDGSSNPEESIQVYYMVIEAVGGDDRVKTNYLLTTLFGVARSWLINLPKGTVHSWDQLCAMFIGNF
jgi:hypothetical protein